MFIFMSNPVCNALGIKYPVIQGAMAWVSTSPLVAAVSNAGGLGVLGVGFAPLPFVRDQIAIITRYKTTAGASNRRTRREKIYSADAARRLRDLSSSARSSGLHGMN